MLRTAWNIMIDNPFKNCMFVHPLQQKKVSELLEVLKQNNNVKFVALFGSSVQTSCHVNSDVDIYVHLDKEESGLLKKSFDFPIDLWTNFMADKRLKTEIAKKGVLVYERDTV